MKKLTAEARVMLMIQSTKTFYSLTLRYQTETGIQEKKKLDDEYSCYKAECLDVGLTIQDIADAQSAVRAAIANGDSNAEGASRIAVDYLDWRNKAKRQRTLTWIVLAVGAGCFLVFGWFYG